MYVIAKPCACVREFMCVCSRVRVIVRARVIVHARMIVRAGCASLLRVFPIRLCVCVSKCFVCMLVFVYICQLCYCA